MTFNNKLDFCVISNPQGETNKYLVFISIMGTNKVDEALCLDPDYEILVQYMDTKGFIEVDSCVFESKIPISTRQELEKLVRSVASLGIRYSKPLEFNIISELQSLRRELGNYPGFEIPDQVQNNNIIFSTFVDKSEEQYKIKNRVPEIGEKIKLNFYIFLQCVFNSERDMLELIGDLYSKDNSNSRNFLKITTSDFIRLESSNPNTIVLQSTKTYKDFLKEINFLHKGSFMYVKHLIDEEGNAVLRTKEFIYNLIEVKKHVNPNHRIIVEVSLNKYYDDMIAMSKKIRREELTEKKKVVDMSDIKNNMIELKERLSGKMLNYAQSDEFERANNVKKDIVFIDKKLQLAENLDKKIITHEDYVKNFCLNY